MAGNPAWGAGHHQGFGEGRDQGQMEGGAAVAVAAALVTALFLAGKWGYGKLRDRRFSNTVHVDSTESDSSTTPDVAAADEEEQEQA
jgi:hypothetical protein